MKKFLKIIPCILVTAFALMGASACRDGVSDVRRRERMLRERQTQEQPLPPAAEPQEKEVDGTQAVEKEPDGANLTESEKENSGKKRCPKCPNDSQKPQSELLPTRGRPHHGKRIKPQPVPFPQPPEEPEN